MTPSKLAEVAKTHDEDVGDRTTSAVIPLVGLLAQVENLIQTKAHSTIIVTSPKAPNCVCKGGALA